MQNNQKGNQNNFGNQGDSGDMEEGGSKAVLVYIIIAIVIVIGIFIFVRSRNNDDMKTDTMVYESENIKVTSPSGYAEIKSPVTIAGEARVFENTFGYRIKDEDGTVLKTGIGHASTSDVGEFGSFTITTTFTKPKGGTGMIEVFDGGAKEGDVEEVVSVPVMFEGAVMMDDTMIKDDTMVKDDSMMHDTTMMSVSVYFPKNAASQTSCATVMGVARTVPKSVAMARVALQELLKGPTSAEQAAGLTSVIPSGVIIQSLSIASGIASVDFNNALQAGVAGSCRVEAIRNEITSTLKQFPTVQSVIISINGQAQGILQP